MNRLDQFARRFPLVARPRPVCPSLDVRVRDVCDLARAAGAPGSDRLALAASARNKAALIASDCGLPDLARSLCWRQFDLYQHARPLNGRAARCALEPIVNLARLRVREGDGQAAYKLLDALFHSVRSGATSTIDGRVLDFHEFTASTDDRRAICQWLWAVLLSDGVRALTSSGQWATALSYVERHHGVGLRMLDGRQVAILSHTMTGDLNRALEIIQNSTPHEPWEHAIAACLAVLTQPSTDRITGMIEHYLGLDPAPEHLVFRTPAWPCHPRPGRRPAPRRLSKCRGPRRGRSHVGQGRIRRPRRNRTHQLCSPADFHPGTRAVQHGEIRWARPRQHSRAATGRTSVGDHGK